MQEHAKKFSQVANSPIPDLDYRSRRGQGMGPAAFGPTAVSGLAVLFPCFTLIFASFVNWDPGLQRAFAEDKVKRGNPPVAFALEPAQLRPPFAKAYELAQKANEEGKIDDAVRYYIEAIKLQKVRVDNLYHELSMMLEMAGRFDTAEDVMKDFLKNRLSDGERADVLEYLSRAQVNNGNAKEALESIAGSLQLEPDDVGHLFTEGWVYVRSRQWEKAISKFESLRDGNLDNERLTEVCKFFLSNLYVQTGDLRRGEGILEELLEDDPENARANNDLGYLWAEQGKNLEQAEEMIRKGVEAEPENGAYLDTLGWVLFKRGKYGEAISTLEQANKTIKNGGDATWLDHLGDVQSKLMDQEKAIESWKRALSSAELDKFGDPKLIERLKAKLKEHKVE